MKNNIKIYRALHSLKQEDISKKLGITLGTYSLKESGKAQFTLGEAKIIADLFNKTIDEIFFENKVNF